MSAHHVRRLLRGPGVVRLFTVRLAAQFGDGVFQASLAGAVLFNPERQASATDIAAGFAVLLLPWSLLGPFAGVLLDRWWRRRTLVVANLMRAVGVAGIAAALLGGLHGLPFYAAALVVLSLSRFVLSGLSAALPHVLEAGSAAPELVTANALATTAGAIATTVGGASALGARLLTGATSSAADALMALAAAVPYLLAAAAAGGFGLAALGPDDTERARRESVAEVARGLAAGARHLWSRRPARQAFAVIAVHRLCYGLIAVITVLLFRHRYAAEGLARSGLAGLAQFIVLTAVGGGVAALVTPAVTRRIGTSAWTVLLLAASGAACLGLVLPFRLPLHLVAGLVLGLTSQAIKIGVDSRLQTGTDDAFRGRVFALYDAAFNLALVLAATVTACVLPADGHSPVTVVLVAAGYLVTAAVASRTRVEPDPVRPVRPDRSTGPVDVAATTA